MSKIENNCVRIGRKPELLAPAGEPMAAYAAFAFGADAVYTGLPRFSARAGAVNTTPRELEEMVAYAHSFTPVRRVYVTLNTLIRQSEQAELIRALAICADCDVDAVIVQDLGVLRLAQTFFPKLRVHASTQMAIHNLEGVQQAARLGCQRVTLARELTLTEIREILDQSPIEVETFIYGALCYSYSGLCQYSALLRNGSGNRGSCAYPCRDVFSPSDHSSKQKTPLHPFSMKDYRLTRAELMDLVQTGVHSLKIEGRKKSPLYVAAVVNYYRHLLDGTFRAGEQKQAEMDMQTIFSRRQTNLYFQEFKNPDVTDLHMTGHRGAMLGKIEKMEGLFIGFRTSLPLEVHDGIQFEWPGEERPLGFAVEEIHLNSPTAKRNFSAEAGQWVWVRIPHNLLPLRLGMTLYLASSQVVKKRYAFDSPNTTSLRRRFPLTVTLRMSGSGTIRFIARVYTESQRLAVTQVLTIANVPMKNPEQGKKSIRHAFEKLGDTSFSLKTLRLPAYLPFIPISILNQMRRTLTEELTQKLEFGRQEQIDSIIQVIGTSDSSSPVPMPIPRWILKTDQPSVLLDLPPNLLKSIAEITLVPSGKDLEMMDHVVAQLALHTSIRISIPLLMRSWERSKIQEMVRHFEHRGQTLWEVGNLYALSMFSPNSNKRNITADWSLYALNGNAVDFLAQQGIRRFTFSPEDTLENKTTLAWKYPHRGEWPVLSETPLFISEACPLCTSSCKGEHAACSRSEVHWHHSSGEKITTYYRNRRAYTLLSQPQYQPIPKGLPVLSRFDFLFRPWTPENMTEVLKKYVRNETGPSEE